MKIFEYTLKGFDGTNEDQIKWVAAKTQDQANQIISKHHYGEIASSTGELPHVQDRTRKNASIDYFS